MKGTVQVTLTSCTEQTGESERFSGAVASGSDLKRWKSWCLAEMNMSSLPREARGPSFCTMLDGDGLLAVEDLEFRVFAVEGSENLIFSILDARFPGEDSFDRQISGR